MSTPSARKIRANRRNARKSTGPRTPQGKGVASMNAVTHGVYCRHIVLDGENRAAFDRLRQHFIHALMPQNHLELSFVERIVSNQWRTDRLEEAEANCYAFRRAAHQNAIDKMCQGEAETDPRLDDWLEHLEKLDDVSQDPQYQQICSAMGSSAMTMNSLIGDYKSELERYDLMRYRLEGSTSRALRELNKLQAEAKKNGTFGPSPFCAEHIEQMDALMRQEFDEDEDEDEDEEKGEAQEQSSTTSSSEMKNEPTAGNADATADGATTCGDAPAPTPADVVRMTRSAKQQVQQRVADELLGEEET